MTDNTGELLASLARLVSRLRNLPSVPGYDGSLLMIDDVEVEGGVRVIEAAQAKITELDIDCALYKSLADANCESTAQYLALSKRVVRELEPLLANALRIISQFNYEADEDSSAGMSFFEARLNEDDFFSVQHQLEKAVLESKK